MNRGWLGLVVGLWISVGPLQFRAGAQTIDAPFGSLYSSSDLGNIPGVPTPYGGVNFALGNANQLIVGANATSAAGGLYSIDLARDASGHISGFSGTAAKIADTPYIDGGLAYGPSNVLFVSGWPANQLSQLKPGSTSVDKTVALGPLGVETSNSAVNFVPTGFAGAGRMKLVSYIDGQWNDALYSADGSGTYNIPSVTEVPASRLPNGPEAFVYVPPLSPGFAGPSMLVNEYGSGTIVSYQVNSNGDPIVSSRQMFMSGLIGPEGSCIDPSTGDLVLTTFDFGNHLLIVRGFLTELLGDFNVDGQLTSADIPAMLSALTDLPAYQSVHGLSTAQLLQIGDVNHSGSITNGDAQALLDLIALQSGSGSITAVPEPTALVLAGIAVPFIVLIICRQNRRVPLAALAKGGSSNL